MLQFENNIVDSFQKISTNRGRLQVVANQRFNHIHLFGCGFIILLCGYTRCFLHELTPYLEKKRELTQDIFNWLKDATLHTCDIRRDLFVAS